MPWSVVSASHQVRTGEVILEHYGPSVSNSPWILWYPQLRFSRPCAGSAPTPRPRGVDGRGGGDRSIFLAARRRGQRRIVPGVTGRWLAQHWWQPPDERGEDRSIRPVQTGLGVDSAQHGDFVTQHQELNVLRRRRAAQATTAGSPAGGSSSKGDATTRLTIMPWWPSTPITQVKGAGRLLKPHRAGVR
jgi:hypothetical protein